VHNLKLLLIKLLFGVSRETIVLVAGQLKKRLGEEINLDMSQVDVEKLIRLVEAAILGEEDGKRKRKPVR